MVRDNFRNCKLFSTVDEKLNAEGSNQERNQIFRHFNAKQSLMEEPFFTLDNVKRVHSILMKNYCLLLCRYLDSLSSTSVHKARLGGAPERI